LGYSTPSVAPVKARKVDHALRRKGFEAVGGDHMFYVFVVDGKSSGIFTKISRGHEEITDKNLGRMARQMKMTRRDFDAFVDCQFSQEEYVEALRSRGEL